MSSLPKKRSPRFSALCLLAACTALAFCSKAVAQETPETELSRGRYERRQKATMEMWRKRGELREEVQKAARHPDPEVAGRAQWVLRQWRRGAVPGMPHNISRLLQSDGPAAVEQLLEYGQFRAAVVAVEESAGTVDLESIQGRVNKSLRDRFPIYAALALEQGTIPDLLDLVDLSANSAEMAICRIQLMQFLGLKAYESRLLPKAAETWSELEQREAECLVRLHLQQHDETLALARSVDEETLIMTLLLMRRWEDLAQLHAKMANKADPETLEYTRHWANVLITSDRSGNKQLASQAIEVLGLRPGEIVKLGNGLAFNMRWRSLVLHGQIDKAIELLRIKAPTTAAEIAINSARPELAFELLGYQKDELGTKLDEWIDETLEAQLSNENNIDPMMRRMLGLMRVLIAIGYDEPAWTIASRLATEIHETNRNVRDWVLFYLELASKERWVFDLAISPGERQFSGSAESYICDSLPDCDTTSLGILMDAVGYIMPGTAFRDRFRVVTELFSGEMPIEFGTTKADQDQMFQRLYRRLTGKSQPIRGRVAVNPTTQLTENVITMLARQGQVSLATQALSELSQSGDIKSTLALAQNELLRGRTDSAIDYLDQVWDQVAGSSANQGMRVEAGYAAKALVKRWVVAEREGNMDQARLYERQLKLTLCTPSTSMRLEIANFLADQGRMDLSRKVFETLLPMSVFGSIEVVDLYDVTRNFATSFQDTDPKASAQWFDLGLSTIAESGFAERAYVTLPMFVCRWGLEGAIRDKDEPKARKYIERILELDPVNIDFAERLLPELREAGIKGLADETFNTVFDAGLEHTKRFPFDAMKHNNVAWLAATNKSRIQEALPLSEHACLLEPESAIYRDTLAELLFLLGRVDEALMIEQHCVLDDPGEWHLHTQIKKYEEVLKKQE